MTSPLCFLLTGIKPGAVLDVKWLKVGVAFFDLLIKFRSMGHEMLVGSANCGKVAEFCCEEPWLTMKFSRG